MLLWIVLAVFLLPLIYVILNIKQRKSAHQQQLDIIQKKIAEKERQNKSRVYAVIFRAEINELDRTYSEMAARMRELAMNDYGCLEFVSCMEGDSEIAISYWPDKEKILAWKNNPEHLEAQKQGKSKWYKSYTVQIVEVLRQYESAKSGE